MSHSQRQDADFQTENLDDFSFISNKPIMKNWSAFLLNSKIQSNLRKALVHPTSKTRTSRRSHS